MGYVYEFVITLLNGAHVEHHRKHRLIFYTKDFLLIFFCLQKYIFLTEKLRCCWLIMYIITFLLRHLIIENKI